MRPAQGRVKQVVRVLVAVKAGARTSGQVAAATGLPLKHCAAWLGALEREGLVRCDRRHKIQAGPSGRLSNAYRPA